MDRVSAYEKVSSANKRHIEEFLQWVQSNGVKERRQWKYKHCLANIALKLDKDFGKATEKNIRDYVAWLEGSDYQPWTKHDYKVVLKAFYRWLEGKGKNYPEKVDWITTSIKRKDQKLPKILSEDEVKRMITNAKNIRDKALISFLYESGVRAGELLGLRFKDIVFDDHGAIAIVTGKTGMRRLRLVASEQHLRNWMNSHPSGKPDDYLWVAPDGKLISGRRFADILEVTANRAKLDKHVHPHLFRHTRATILARFLTEQELKVFFGWVGGSEMASVYVHLSGQDLDDAILGKVYGKKEAEQAVESEFKEKTCVRCGKRNPPDARFCNCGMALDLQAAMQIDQQRRVLDQVMEIAVKTKRSPEEVLRELAQRKR